MEFQLSKSSIMIATLDHAHYMIQELPKWVNSDIEPVLQIAALEDWFTNIRLIGEFYRISGKDKSSDFSVNDFFPDFVIDEEHKKELNELWLIASKHVSHLSRERLPEENVPVDPFDFTLENLTRISIYVHQIYNDFKERLNETETRNLN